MGAFDRFKKKVTQADAATEEPPAYGWDAITARFEELYPGQVNPRHYGTLLKYRLGGKDPLDGISIYDGGEFWHFVTYGFSDLYVRGEGGDPEWSGGGFELTLKLKKLSWIDQPELENVLGILQSLARYAFSNQRIFVPYEYIYTKQTRGIDQVGRSKLTGFATLPDDAGIIETPLGKVEFVCLVGLTDKELVSIVEQRTTTEAILEKLGSPLTNYERDDVI